MAPPGHRTWFRLRRSFRYGIFRVAFAARDRTAPLGTFYPFGTFHALGMFCPLRAFRMGTRSYDGLFQKVD